jgi:uncharacterized protein (UPF0254 family)
MPSKPSAFNGSLTEIAVKLPSEIVKKVKIYSILNDCNIADVMAHALEDFLDEPVSKKAGNSR